MIHVDLDARQQLGARAPTLDPWFPVVAPYRLVPHGQVIRRNGGESFREDWPSLPTGHRYVFVVAGDANVLDIDAHLLRRPSDDRPGAGIEVVDDGVDYGAVLVLETLVSGSDPSLRLEVPRATCRSGTSCGYTVRVFRRPESSSGEFEPSEFSRETEASLQTRGAFWTPRQMKDRPISRQPLMVGAQDQWTLLGTAGRKVEIDVSTQGAQAFSVEVLQARPDGELTRLHRYLASAHEGGQRSRFDFTPAATGKYVVRINNATQQRVFLYTIAYRP
jgi:hypothetical protein